MLPTLVALLVVLVLAIVLLLQLVAIVISLILIVIMVLLLVATIVESIKSRFLEMSPLKITEISIKSRKFLKKTAFWAKKA